MSDPETYIRDEYRLAFNKLVVEFNQLTQENADLRSKLEKAESTHTEVVAKQLALRAEAEAKCAQFEAMAKDRGVLLLHSLSWVACEDCPTDDYCDVCGEQRRLTNYALSTSCGTGYRSPEDYAALEAKVKVLMELITWLDDYLAGARSFLPTRSDIKKAFAKTGGEK